MTQLSERTLAKYNTFSGNDNYFKSLSTAKGDKWRHEGNKYFRGADPGAALMYLIGMKGKSVSYNPYLTTPMPADFWLNKQKQANPKFAKWSVTAEDLDSDPTTPDDVLVLDGRGRPQIVSGFRITNPESRRRAAVLYNMWPDKKKASAARKEITKNHQLRLLKRWQSRMAHDATSFQPYSNKWAQYEISEHPKISPDYYNADANVPPYRLFQRWVHAELKRLLKTGQPHYMEAANEAIRAVFDPIREQFPTKDGLRAEIMTKGAAHVASAVQIYEAAQKFLAENYNFRNDMFYAYQNTPSSMEKEREGEEGRLVEEGSEEESEEDDERISSSSHSRGGKKKKIIGSG
jgi:hypothetical protein